MVAYHRGRAEAVKKPFGRQTELHFSKVPAGSLGVPQPDENMRCYFFESLDDGRAAE
jgi:hypothetical protein